MNAKMTYKQQASGLVLSLRVLLLSLVHDTWQSNLKL